MRLLRAAKIVIDLARFLQAAPFIPRGVKFVKLGACTHA
jgi:hypothetical protein